MRLLAELGPESTQVGNNDEALSTNTSDNKKTRAYQRFSLEDEDAVTSQRPQKRRKLDADHDSLSAPHNTWLRSSSHRGESLFSAVSASYNTSSNIYQYSRVPPTTVDLISTMEFHGLPSKIYQDPYYSVDSDASDHPWEFAGLSYHIKGGTGIGVLEEWQEGGASFSKVISADTRLWGWEYASSPPSIREVRRWWKTEGQHLRTMESGQKSSQVTDVLPHCTCS